MRKLSPVHCMPGRPVCPLTSSKSSPRTLPGKVSKFWGVSEFEIFSKTLQNRKMYRRLDRISERKPYILSHIFGGQSENLREISENFGTLLSGTSEEHEPQSTTTTFQGLKFVSQEKALESM